MKTPTPLHAAIFGLLTLLSGVTFGGTSTNIYVSASSEADIQNAINSLPAKGGTIIVSTQSPNNTVPIHTSIVIARNNVTLSGEGGVILRLLNGAQHPVIIIGGTAFNPPVTYHDINVSDFIIDGNGANQLNEEDSSHNYITNSGIRLRKVNDCSVRRVTVHHCRSGGIVTERFSARLTLSDIHSHHNILDGIGGYDTKDSIFSHLRLHDNEAAGLSFDDNFDGNVVSDAVIADNLTSGIFMRDARDNVFANFQIRNSHENGIFLAQHDDPSRPALGNTFHGFLISGSGAGTKPGEGFGIKVADESCTDNLVDASQLVNNRDGNISDTFGKLTFSGIQR